MPYATRAQAWYHVRTQGIAIYPSPISFHSISFTSKTRTHILGFSARVRARGSVRGSELVSVVEIPTARTHQEAGEEGMGEQTCAHHAKRRGEGGDKRAAEEIIYPGTKSHRLRLSR